MIIRGFLHIVIMVEGRKPRRPEIKTSFRPYRKIGFLLFLSYPLHLSIIHNGENLAYASVSPSESSRSPVHEFHLIRSRRFEESFIISEKKIVLLRTLFMIYFHILMNWCI